MPLKMSSRPVPKPRSSKRPKAKKANVGQDRGRLYTVTNVAMLTPANVTVTNSTYAFSSGTIELNLNGLRTAGLTWESGLMSLYDLFKFTKLRVRWVPAVSTFTTGTVGVYYDPDPSATAPTSFKCLTGNAGLRLTQIGRPLTLTVTQAQLNRLPWYNTSTDHSSATQGQIVYAFSPGSMPSGSGPISLGHFLLEYTLVLKNPTSGCTQAMNPQVLPVIAEEISQQITSMQPANMGTFYREMVEGEGTIRPALDVSTSGSAFTFALNTKSATGRTVSSQADVDDGLVQKNFANCTELVAYWMASLDPELSLADPEKLATIHDLAQVIDDQMSQVTHVGGM